MEKQNTVENCIFTIVRDVSVNWIEKIDCFIEIGLRKLKKTCQESIRIGRAMIMEEGSGKRIEKPQDTSILL